MAKKTGKCFFCRTEIDLNGHHVIILGPDGKDVYSCPYHNGLSEHNGTEINIPKPKPEIIEKEVTLE